MSNKRTLNLDEARRARAEKKGPPPEIALDGQTYVLPPSPPALAFVVLAEVQGGDLRRLELAFELLFGAENAGELLERGLDLDDLEDILDVYDINGDGLGEGSTSGGSSSKNSGRSRRPSKGSTASS